MNFPHCGTDAVPRRALLGALSLLHDTDKSGAVEQKLLRAPVAQMASALQWALDALFVALYSRGEEQRGWALAQLADALDSTEAATTPQYFNQASLIAQELELQEVAVEAGATEHAWHEACELLAALDHPSHDWVRRNVLGLIGLKCERGAIHAFSDEHLPGFVAFGVNNPRGVLAEQLVHESVHTLLWSYLQLHPSVDCPLARQFATYSPFVERPRSAVRVLHGVLSYAAVHAFWSRVLDSGMSDAALELPYQRAHLRVTQRLKVLQERINSGMITLRQAFALVDMEHLASALSLDWALEGVCTKFSGKASLSEQLRVVQGAPLSDISKAEIALALTGNKCSRVVLPAEGVGFLLPLARAGTHFLVGRQGIKPASDILCGGFSNTVGSTCPVDSDEPGMDVFVYFGPSPEEVRQTAELDECNQAAPLLGIPPCCEAYFEEHWDAVRLRGGDLFSHLLRAQPERTSAAGSCNAAGMYFGWGLCWHFPCSLNCRSTSEIVSAREKVLMQLDPPLRRRLGAYEKGLLLWSTKHGYAFLSAHPENEPVPPSTSWLSGEPFYTSGSEAVAPIAWVSQSVESGELRRMVTFS